MRLFDLHCDTIYELYRTGGLLDTNTGHVDLRRGGRFEAWSQVFAVWIPDEWRGTKACEGCDAMLRLAKAQFAQFSDRVMPVRNGIEMRQALAQGRCAAWLSVEGGAALGGRIDRVTALADQGVRIMTLTWNGGNELGHGCLTDVNDGLTAFGKSVLGEMQRVGMIPDVSHLNAHGFDDVAELVSGPFLATHSVSKAVHAHPRNLTDRQFEIIRDHGGLVGLNVCASQLGVASFECLQRHLDHFLTLGGENILAFGCDFDGTHLPDSWGGIAVMEEIGDFLIRKHYSTTLIDKIFFKNAYEFFDKL